MRGMSEGARGKIAVGRSGSTTLDPDQPSPRMYRPMKADGSFPMTGASATSLGARTPKDIPTDGHGRVRPETGGMSVRPRIADIPAVFLPRRLISTAMLAEANPSSSFVTETRTAASMLLPSRRGYICGPTLPGMGMWSLTAR